MGQGKRTTKLSIRLTPEEYKHFLAIQRSSGLHQAEFLMRLVDGIPLPDERVLNEYKEINAKIDELKILIKNIEPN